ncbi:MAG: hypothetical protein AB7T31_11060 [Gemmatimonadales bacterium]
MARVKIFRPDGTPSPFFWNDEKERANPLKTVYKTTSDGIKRLRGVRYDVANNTFPREEK